MLARTQCAVAVFAASSVLRFHRPWFFAAASSNSQFALAGAQHPSASLRTSAAPLQCKSSTLCLLLSAPLARSGIVARGAAIPDRAKGALSKRHSVELLHCRGAALVLSEAEGCCAPASAN